MKWAIVWLLVSAQVQTPLDSADIQQELIALIANTSPGLTPGQDTVETRASFEGAGTGLCLVVTEFYIDPAHGKVAMKETRRIPLSQIQGLSLLNGGRPDQSFMVVVRYWPEGSSSNAYFSQRLENHPNAALVLSWPLRWYSRETAQRILDQLSRLCQDGLPDP